MSDEEIEVSISFTYVLTSEGVAFYAEKTIRELQDTIQQEINDMTTEELISKYGEPNRKLITEAIIWLEEEAPNWNFGDSVDFDRDQFIHNLIQQKAK